MKRSDENRLEAFETKSLRQILPVLLSRTWDSRTRTRTRT